MPLGGCKRILRRRRTPGPGARGHDAEQGKDGKIFKRFQTSARSTRIASEPSL